MSQSRSSAPSSPASGLASRALSLTAGLALVACGDLIPRPPAPEDTDTRDAAEDSVESDLPDLGTTECTTDLDCAPYAGCCLAVSCVSARCVPSYVPSCCVVEGPCAVDSALRSATCEATCAPLGCIERLRLGNARCDETIWELPMTTEGIAALRVVEAPSERLTWHLSPLRTFLDAPTLRAGDLLCPSYHGGSLGPRCEVLAPGGPVAMSAETTNFIVPSDIASLVELWVRMDVPATAGLTTPLDALELSLVGERFEASLWSSGRSPIPVGRWTPVLADLTPWAGQTIRLRLRFDTGDGRDNDHEGVAIGKLRVRTACEADRTASGGDACHEARLTPVASVRPMDDALVVLGPPRGSEDTACEPCAAATTCARPDPCDQAACTQGRCALTQVIDPACCAPMPSFPGGGSFEDALDGWTLSGPWASSELRSVSGQRALHFGRPDGAGIAMPGEAARGEAWSPPVAVPTVPPSNALAVPAPPTLGFSLWLSTEWDLAPSFDNPGGVDRLEALVALVLPDGRRVLPQTVWTSTAIGGTTLAAWRPIALDLTPWAGRTVSIGWRFDTVDAEANDGEGVWIDDAAVYRRCPDCACDTCPGEGDLGVPCEP